MAKKTIAEQLEDAVNELESIRPVAAKVPELEATLAAITKERDDALTAKLDAEQKLSDQATQAEVIAAKDKKLSELEDRIRVLASQEQDIETRAAARAAEIVRGQGADPAPLKTVSSPEKIDKRPEGLTGFKLAQHMIAEQLKKTASKE